VKFKFQAPRRLRQVFSLCKQYRIRTKRKYTSCSTSQRAMVYFYFLRLLSCLICKAICFSAFIIFLVILHIYKSFVINCTDNVYHVHRDSMQRRQMMEPETTASSDTSGNAAALLNPDHRQLSPPLEVPVVHVKQKRYRPKSFEESLAFLSPHQRLLATQDPAYLRFKLQKTPSTYSNDESDVEAEIQEVGGIHYFHHCSFNGCKRKFRCVPHIPRHCTNAPPPLHYGCRCLKENGYDMAKCYCSSGCYYQVVRPYNLY
jgi:hypothetical protein